MSDLISRQAVNTLVDELARAISDERCFLSRGRSTGEIMSDILNLPSVENKGEWVEWKGRNGRYNGIPVCSNCNTGFPIFAKDYNFCPNCGADMRPEPYKAESEE